jgi:hypothetical protein
MLDIGPGEVDDRSMLIFVDRLGVAGTDRAAARAHQWVRRAVGTGAAPPGLRHIAEGLSAAGTGERPPPPRLPAGDPAALVAALRDSPLLVLDDVTTEEAAAAVGALVDDGRRVVVTGAEAAERDAVRGALPAGARERVVDALPVLAPAELHRLRALLATSTPARRARAAQQLPDLAALPNAGEVAGLCAAALRPSRPGTERVASVLAELDRERRAAVTAIAQCVQRSLTTLGAHTEPWVWELLDDLVHGRRRSEVERLVQTSAQALTTIDDGRDDPPVQVLAPLPEAALNTLVAYLDYRESGGRTRSYFPPAAQREVEPVLRLLRVDGRRPETSLDLRVVLTHFELGERLVAVDADCADLGLPTPRNQAELGALSAALTDIAAAARSVGALRHDVLFLQPGSPVAVPDVAAARQLALAVLDYDENGSVAHAAARLDAMAEALGRLARPEAAAPEHVRAVAALRARDAAGYAEAAEQLVGAHRQRHDERRAATLLAELGSPTLATAWMAEGPVRFGFVWFVAAARLLEELPPADRADVVVVLDAGCVGMDRALLAAAAPRMVAAVRPGARSAGATLLGLLHRASAVVVTGSSADAAGEVVPLTPGARPVPLPARGAKKAGA